MHIMPLLLESKQVQLTDLSREGLGFLRDPKLLVEQACVQHALRENALDPLRRGERAAFRSTCPPPYQV